MTPTPETRPLLVAFALFVTAIVLACATVSNDNLPDLKAGQLVGASPMEQQIALIVGVVAANPLPAPQATLMSALAQGVIGGSLDWKVIGIGAAVGLVLIVIDAVLRAAKKGSLPPLAVGIGIYLPMSATCAVVVGAVLSHRYNKRAAAACARALRTIGHADGVGHDRWRMEFPGFSGDAVGAAGEPLRIVQDSARVDDCGDAFDCRRYRCSPLRQLSPALGSYRSVS